MPAKDRGKKRNLDVLLSTIHAAKGLESDFVIVVGLRQGRSGFPAEKPIDPFREAFLPIPESFDFAEERRLFYVALTRARHRVYLLYDKRNCSRFVDELMCGRYPVAIDEFPDHSWRAGIESAAWGGNRPAASDPLPTLVCDRFREAS